MCVELVEQNDMLPQTHQELIKSLRRKGLRITPQREMILTAFAENDQHLTAEQIFEKVHRSSSSVNIATVYRNLDMLREYGILTVTVIPGGPLEWELASDHPHHHLVCEHCHRVLQIPESIVNDLTAQLLTQHGFHANLKHLALTGLCADCAQLLESKQKPTGNEPHER